MQREISISRCGFSIWSNSRSSSGTAVGGIGPRLKGPVRCEQTHAVDRMDQGKRLRSAHVGIAQDRLEAFTIRVTHKADGVEKLANQNLLDLLVAERDNGVQSDQAVGTERAFPKSGFRSLPLLMVEDILQYPRPAEFVRVGARPIFVRRLLGQEPYVLRSYR